MKETRGDLFNQTCDATVITTNGFVKKSTGHAVMGKGCAHKAAQLYLQLPQMLGYLLERDGNHIHSFAMPDGKLIVTFPVKPVTMTCADDNSNVVSHMKNKFKPGDTVPGWAVTAQMEIIQNSAVELLELANEKQWEDIVIPRPGCGAGELEWSEVKPVLEEILDDRFIAITF